MTILELSTTTRFQRKNIAFLLDNYGNIVYNETTIKSYRKKAVISMTRKFVYTAPFRHSWKAMGLNDDDLLTLESALLENPQIGDVIEGTGGARKLRIQLESRGKSGGGRVIYLDVFEKESLYLLFAYPKSVQPDLKPEQKKAIRAMVAAIKKE